MLWIVSTLIASLVACHFVGIGTAIITGIIIFILIPQLGGPAVDSNKIAKLILWPFWN